MRLRRPGSSSSRRCSSTRTRSRRSATGPCTSAQLLPLHLPLCARLTRRACIHPHCTHVEAHREPPPWLQSPRHRSFRRTRWWHRQLHIPDTETSRRLLLPLLLPPSSLPRRALAPPDSSAIGRNMRMTTMTKRQPTVKRQWRMQRRHRQAARSSTATAMRSWAWREEECESLLSPLHLLVAVRNSFLPWIDVLTPIRSGWLGGWRQSGAERRRAAVLQSVVCPSSTGVRIRIGVHR